MVLCRNNAILLDPLFQVFQFLFEARALCPSLIDADISSIPKKWNVLDECYSYRPISVLNLDMKLLAKVLALRLEKILPNIITND